MTKEEYIKYTNDNFDGLAKDIVLKQIDLFYNPVKIKKTKYAIGDTVCLKKGTFIHGISGYIDSFDYVMKNGFVSSDFTGLKNKNKFFNNVGMWNIQKNCLLKDYIKTYSGLTIGYRVKNRRGINYKTKLIAYKNFESEIDKINDDPNVLIWKAEQTKEIRFIPSLASNKRQIAFILNMNSSYAKEMKKADVYKFKNSREVLKYFVVEDMLDKFMNEKVDSFMTDRESAIFFGLPTCLIEGVLVGRKLEKDNKSLEYIKNKLPDCYICNLDGVVVY